VFAGLLFQLASWLGAFLLFLVQPVTAKQLLPWFGGAASVWTTCLLFFQTALVVGYGYAYLAARLPFGWQRRVHAVLLLASLAFLPLVLPETLQPQSDSAPAWRVLLVLLLCVGAPYVLLASTAPLLQHWYARQSRVGQPYRLYVHSNAGSLFALLGYPALIEPVLTTEAQALLWSVGYIAFLLLCLACAWLPNQELAAVESNPIGSVELSRGSLCALLAACGSALLLATTNRMSQDVAAIPLLWVLPLSLYLITFIVAFAGYYRRRPWLILYVMAAIASGWTLIAGPAIPMILQVSVLAGLLTTGCMLCHGELFGLRPAADRLTSFYLLLGAGGAVGGLFVAVIAPLLFTSYVELPFVAILIPALVFIAVAVERLGTQSAGLSPAFVAGPVALAALAVTVVVIGDRGPVGTVAAVRSFYGTLFVVDDPPDAAQRMRRLFHGRILHGGQWMDPARRHHATSYYGQGSGIHVAIAQHPKRIAGQGLQIGIVGLGVGATAAWTTPADRITFYELDPHVVEIAQTWFSFLELSPGAVDIRVGDGRLSLERDVDAGGDRPGYDVLALDAFSGDSVPVHLLTREAFALYTRALAPGGLLAVHVSNLHLDLERVVRGLARDMGRGSVLIRQDSRDDSLSEWVLVPSDERFLAQLEPLGAPASAGAPVVWTDQFSSLFSVLR
jgi:spermidine synthase